MELCEAVHHDSKNIKSHEKFNHNRITCFVLFICI